MRHLTLPRFWSLYRQLPAEGQTLADESFEVLKADPYHALLHLKRTGGARNLWSVRIGAHYRALGVEKLDCIVWFWIGNHADYDRTLP